MDIGAIIFTVFMFGFMWFMAWVIGEAYREGKKAAREELERENTSGKK